MDLDLRGGGRARLISMVAAEVLGKGECLRTLFPDENPMGEFSRGWKHPYHL